MLITRYDPPNSIGCLMLTVASALVIGSSAPIPALESECSAQPTPLSTSKQLALAVEDPTVSLIRGRILHVESGTRKLGGIREVGVTISTVEVDTCYFGAASNQVSIISSGSLQFNGATPGTPLTITGPEGSIWYKKGDEVLMLIRPHESGGTMPSATARFVRFISGKAEDGEIMTSYQTDYSIKNLRMLVKQKLAEGSAPSSDELYGAIDRFVVQDRPLVQVLSEITAMRPQVRR